jgi:ABC-2 type transport system permease protein
MTTTNLSAMVPGVAGYDMPTVRLVRAYALEARNELLQLLRAPGMVIPFLLLPVPLYVFFGVVLAGSSPDVRANPELANYIFSGWCVYAAMGPAIFGVGCPLAVEREAGLLKLKRALPSPTGSYLTAKMVTAMGFALLAVGSVVASAIVAGQITLSGGELLRHATVMILGAIPFAAIGLFIGSLTSGSASAAVANVVFLPMLWLAGLFFPLPKSLEPWVVIWPAFHLNQIGLAVANVEGFRFVNPLMSAVVLAGITVLLGGLAIRRLATRG